MQPIEEIVITITVRPGNNWDMQEDSDKKISWEIERDIKRGFAEITGMHPDDINIEVKR